MKEFSYLRPSDREEVSQLLNEFGEEAKIIAGGTALMLVMRQRMLNPSYLISLENLKILNNIQVIENEGISIGALCTHNDIARSQTIKNYFPIINSMAQRVANPQVRNQGTIGGNICYADPSTDPTTCFLSLNANVVLANQSEIREIPLHLFLVDYFTTDIKQDEILLSIKIPFLKKNYKGIYYRHLKTKADHRPIFNFSLVVDRSGDECTDLRLAIGASLPIAKRIEEVESMFKGKVITLSMVETACELIEDKYEFLSDFRANDIYRKVIAKTALKREFLNTFGLL